MKNWRKIVAVALVLAMSVSLVACGGGTPASSAAPESSKVEESKAEESKAEESKAEESKAEESKAEESTAETTTEGSTPRNETLYLNGIQWGKANDMNPFSSNSNFMAMDQNDAAREMIYETLYMFNVLDGKLYPLLADGDPVWNADNTEMTVKIKAAAKWSDGTPVTANDVAYTFATHIKYQSNTGVDYGQYIESVTATDDSTVVFKAKADKLNPLKLKEYLPKVFVAQKAYIETIEKKTGEKAETFKIDPMFDAPHTGPYGMFINNEQKVGVERDDKYWGQDASMWGALPAPKYIVHNIYSGNDAGDTAMRAGEIDVSQQFIANVQKMWENDGLEISTYYADAPYHLPGTMPSAYFNVTKEGLDQKAVRQAIAYAVDYDQVIATAMTNQSPSFTDVPRSLFNPSKAEREIDSRINTAYKDLQWTGKEYDRANKVLDDAGIVDTNGDGNREYNGKELAFKAECPTGWTDWNASMELVADAGQYIGIKIETYFPESTVWTEDIQTGNYDIIMNSPAGFSVSNPWTRAYQLMYGFGGEFPERVSFAYSRYYNADVDAALAAIPTETDQAKLDEYYTTLNKAYLEDVPSFALMYRPVWFHTVYEGVWTGFPEDGDGTNIPPAICLQGYGIAALYKIHNV